MAGTINAERIGELMQTTLQELKRVGGVAGPKMLMNAIAPKLKLSDYEKEILPSGTIRWETFVRFYSVDCSKAGYITKEGGKWTLTEKGEKALKMPPLEFIRSAQLEYRKWKRGKAPTSVPPTDEGTIEIQGAYETALENANTEIENHINDLGPYDFQKLVGELLIGMGYHVPFVASPGKDGGIDLVAYNDPLGTSAPRIKVQVKHRDQKVTVKEVREMEGILRKEGDIGLIVSSGGFTTEVEKEIRSSTKHIETMDMGRLIKLWQEHYDKLREQGKLLLPLVRLYFLKPFQEQ